MNTHSDLWKTGTEPEMDEDPRDGKATELDSPGEASVNVSARDGRGRETRLASIFCTAKIECETGAAGARTM